MIATNENWNDLKKYYECSYIKINGFGDKLFYVSSVNKEKIVGYDSENTPFELWLSTDYPYTLDYVLPHHAVFQYGNEAVQLRRRPNRQYRRGLHPDNVRIASVLRGSAYPLDFPILEAYVGKQQYPSFQEAVKSSCISVAISARMSYSRDTNYIYIDTHAVALVEGDKIRMIKRIFTKEIQHYIDLYGQGFKVEV